MKGHALLKVPGRDSIHQALSFTHDTVADFDVQSSLFLGERDILKNAVTKFLKLAVHQIFRDFWIYPSWRDLELPLISRKPLDPENFPLLMGVHKEFRDGKQMATVWSSGEYTSRPFPPLGLDIGSAAPKPEQISRTSIPDVLEGCTFSVATQLDPQASVMDLEQRLTYTCVRLVKEKNSPSPEGWRTFREKDGILVEKKRVQVPPARGQRSALVGISEFTRAHFVSRVAPSDLFKILRQSEHLQARYQPDMSVTSIERHSFAPTQRVQTVTFLEKRKGSQPKSVTVLEIAGRVTTNASLAPLEETTGSVPQNYVIVCS
ncbi:hypothetical protein M427DRAFT_365831 [Gonapodya prolifera JEL478]|uniref:Uncharacterized protein n=1 Tax=Gonapodya prolifera (strain JEL478) TaxID=1344416 RepID=A0A139AA84_GONPJ|nr:hypothetical protein M427DRAFT_365831 [Gonapodya prolifera JEL478]|eukprot:KXS13650.1 hypothetical protein M427DRAFT_365831 [Gonapodya prolifera JEL478]